MSSTRSKVIAAVSTVIIVSGIMVAVRMNRGETPAAANHAAAATTTAAKPSATRNGTASAASDLSLEDWQHKIAEANLKDFRSLMDAAMQITDAELRNTVVTGIVDRWMLEDSDSFIKYIASLEVSGGGPALVAVMTALQDSLTRLDPERAASDEILVIVQRLINYLANTDPAKALVWAKKWLLDDTLESALLAISRGMARSDIEKSLAIIDQMKSSLRRSQALAAVGAIWAAKDPAAALQWAMGLKYSAERALTLNSVLLAIAQTDAKGASASLLAQAQQISDQYSKDRTAELAATGKTEADYANDPVSYREAVENGIIKPPTSPDLELLENAAREVSRLLALGDPVAAIKQAEALPGDYLKMKAISGALEGWAKIDPAAAYAYVSANYPENMDMIKPLYSSWAATDWRTAADGTSLIADPAKRGLALESVIKTGAALNSNNAGEIASYVSQLPPSINTDGVKAALANSISYQSPEIAWQVAKTISDESAQYRALKNAFANLVIQDPAQAGNLLNTSKFSDTTSERLKDMLDAVVGN
jgi:hypothetical protein